jgi:Suppressor of fused protein (SUFU)
MDEGMEYTPAGQPVYRHTARERDSELTTGDQATADTVTAHVEAHIGVVDRVWHELVSDRVHLDVLVVEPTAERSFTTLVTSGMSGFPMIVPAEAPTPLFAELMTPEEFATLTTDTGKEISFYGLVALHADELDLRLAEGTDRLLDHLDAAGVNELLDPARPSSLAARRG